MEIKFRKKDLTKAMRRIDPTYRKLMEQLGKKAQRWHLPEAHWWGCQGEGARAAGSICAGFGLVENQVH